MQNTKTSKIQQQNLMEERTVRPERPVKRPALKLTEKEIRHQKSEMKL